MATSAEVEGVDKVFKPYVLEIALSGSEEDGSSLCLALVVIRKPSGLLLAVPSGFFPEHMLEEGQSAGPMELIGPSHYAAVPGGRLETMDGSPPIEGEEQLEVLLVDMGTGVLELLTPVADFSGPTEILYLFSEGDPFMYPLKKELIAAAWDWIYRPDAESRVQYYSVAEEGEEEVPEVEEAMESTPNGPAQPALVMPSAKAKAKSTPVQRQKKPTTASLASSLEAVVAALPTLTSQIAQLNQRTKLMEEQIAQPSRLSALRKPLGKSAIDGSGAASTHAAADLLKEMPPPTSLKTMKPAGPITALAAQLANMSGDPLQELASSSSGFSSRGASGRMKLQQELALQKGTFFAAVMANMSRRMNPSAPSTASPQQLASQGMTMTRYVERFGGFGKARDYGQIMWQIALIMDYLQTENWQGAKDATALLAVCMEQTSLDGAMDVGLLLSLVEDPPSGVFTNRSLAPLSRGKSFAPLADQRWVTAALSFIKERDLITQKRSDLVAGKGANPTDNPTPKVKPKPQPKPWKKKKKRGRRTPQRMHSRLLSSFDTIAWGGNMSLWPLLSWACKGAGRGEQEDWLQGG